MAAAALALLLAAAAAAGAAGAPAAAVTQAGCGCVASWRDAQGGAHDGCANPTSDPKGAWCAVNAATCPGAYGTYKDPDGADVAFDYCGDVRERTDSGCLCAAEWHLEGSGKPAYQDRCAHPDSETVRKCRVAYGTCPPGVAVPPPTYDTCPPLAADDDAPAAPAGASTYHNCSCMEGGWWYLYPAGAAASGPVNKTIFGCANPDGDPLGAWCAVDPEKCPRFAGWVGMDAVNTWAWDYCGAAAPSLARRGEGCAKTVAEWGQCGGKSNCSAWGCADEQWGGACCAAGLECRRQDAYWWQCVNPSVPLGGGGGGGGGAAAGGAAGGSGGAVLESGSCGTSGCPLPPPLPEGLGSNSSVNATAATLTSLQPKGPGAVVYARLRIAYDYAKLAGDVGAQAAFKAKVVAWLKANAAPEEFIYSAGVDNLWNGSTIADAHVTLTADATPDMAAAAARKLQDGAAGLYAGSDLATSYGPLLGAEASTVRTALTLAPAAPLDSPAAPGTPGGDGGNVALGPGAIAGIVIGGFAFVALLVGAVVWRGLASNKERDADKGAQLAYINEMVEADIVAEEEDLARERKAQSAKKPKLPASSGARLRRATDEEPPVAPAAAAAAPSPTILAAAYAAGVAAGAGGGGAGGFRVAPVPGRAASPAALQMAGDAELARLSGSGSGSASGAAGASSGVSYAALKQRHSAAAGSLSGSGSGSGAGTPTAAAAAAAAAQQGASPLGRPSAVGATLSKLGGTVAGLVSGSGAPEAPEKEH